MDFLLLLGKFLIAFAGFGVIILSIMCLLDGLNNALYGKEEK